ncbi:cupin domain-containing protein [Halodesulfovibrio spirochaetisodalis]|uniref:Cupin n=1 Tax=Halodesulfovibrio spirochaetisodalis TaxID=1560234 RepID=A0A1B7XEK1_9BACT|nr:cupin domain-containing protein [Halodesulfovibrio spirochaetisodalis]OBQ52620.1 cupin [Halodesulfovibrio spirochaetisodalis]
MRYKFIRKGEAETYSPAGGEQLAFLATGEDTEGKVSIFDSILSAGNGAPYHYHEIDDEIFYVISGKVEFVVNGEKLVAHARDMVIAGTLVPRSFKALVQSHILVINAPGGPSENFLRDVLTLKTISEADKKRFAEKYKIHIL